MTKPQKGTPEWDLWIAAIEIATAAPWTKNQFATSAKIYWPRIYALRDALDKVGVDWRTAKTAEEEARAEYRKQPNADT